MKAKQAFVLMLCISVVLAFCGLSMAEGKVGYINLQRLVNESRMGKAARANILKLRKKREAEIAKKFQEVKKMRAVLSERGNRMSPDEKRDRVDAFNRAYKTYQRLLADAKDDILKEDRDLVSVILKKADGVLKKVAKKKKYTIILKDPRAIGYLDPKVDITDDVLKELNRK